MAEWWFAPAPASRLGVLRVLVAGYTLWSLVRRRGVTRRAMRAPRRHFRPTGVVRFLRRPVRPGTADALLAATVAANVAVVAGWRHRLTGPVYAGLLLAVTSYRNSWSMLYHNDNLPVLHALVLGVSPSADAVALDARGRPPVPASWRYGWPLRLVNSLTAATYLLAGVAKVTGPLGWRWAAGDALRRQVLVDRVRKQVLGGSAPPAVPEALDREWLWTAAATGSLAAELLAPVALLDRRLAGVWSVGAVGFHVGIRVVMGIRFPYHTSGVPFASHLPLEHAEALVTGWSGGVPT